jgi:purine-binding chemotaxis protein CheW
MDLETGWMNWGSPSGRVNMVAFRLGKQTYALPIDAVRQIIEMVTVIPVPQVKEAVEGVINYHSTTVPIINLRSHLGLPKDPLRLHTPIILVTISGRLVGLIVDEVLDVIERPKDQIVHPKDILPDGLGDAPLLRGLIQTENAVVLLLDLEHLFSSQSTQILAEVAAVLNESSVGVISSEGVVEVTEYPQEAED